MFLFDPATRCRRARAGAAQRRARSGRGLLPVGHDGLAVDEDVSYAGGVLVRLLEGGAIRYLSFIQNLVCQYHTP